MDFTPTLSGYTKLFRLSCFLNLGEQILPDAFKLSIFKNDVPEAWQVARKQACASCVLFPYVSGRTKNVGLSSKKRPRWAQERSDSGRGEEYDTLPLSLRNRTSTACRRLSQRSKDTFFGYASLIEHVELYGTLALIGAL